MSEHSMPQAKSVWRNSIELIVRHRVAATLVFLIVFPWLVPYHALAINILIWGLFALGFNLLYGYAGMLSFGHATFFGAGALLLLAGIGLASGWLSTLGYSM